MSQNFKNKRLWECFEPGMLAPPRPVENRLPRASKSRPCPSQVPQLPWMSVGFPIPLKQDNLTSQHSWAFNMARTHERVQLLDKWGYREPLFNWGTLHTCSGCDVTATWRAPPIWTFAAASICTRICSNFQSYFPILMSAFLAQPAATVNDILWRHERSTQIHILIHF